MFMKASTEVRKFHGTWLRECCRQVEAEVISYRVRKLNMTRKWINRLFGQAQAVWQFFPISGSRLISPPGIDSMQNTD